MARFEFSIGTSNEVAAPLPEASLELLPEVLRTPPWLQRATPRRVPVNGLTPPPREGRVVLHESDLDAANEPIPVMHHEGRLDARNLDDGALLACLEGSWTGRALLLYGLDRLGMRAVPALLRHASQRSVDAYDLLARVDALEVCPVMVDAFARLKRFRNVGAHWLSSFPQTAAFGVIPVALGVARREPAVTALQFLGKTHRSAVLEAASFYGVAALKAVEEVLAEDPLDTWPDRMPRLPAWWNPTAWHRPVLRRAPAALPANVLDTLGLMLAVSTDSRHASLDLVHVACDAASLEAFAWDLFQAWLAAGAPPKGQWAFHALGHFGGGETVRRLTPLLREFPTARAVLGVDVLARIGSDAALLHLHGLARKAKVKALQERAREAIAEIAEARDLSAAELADRLVPHLGLDTPFEFRVGFDETLKPYVTDASGARLPDPPPTLTRWKNLKKDVRAIAREEVHRLELSCVAQRRWDAAAFRTFYVQHPLLFHLTSRLVWAVFDGAPAATFRVTDDRTFVTADGVSYVLPDGATVGLPHPLEVPHEVFARWAEVFAGLDIRQPFPQLARPTFVGTEEERRAPSLARAEGFAVPCDRVLALESRGWRRNPAEDTEMIKPLPGHWEAILHLHPGLSKRGQQTLQGVRVRRPGSWSFSPHLGVLGPVAFSELIADVMTLKS